MKLASAFIFLIFTTAYTQPNWIGAWSIDSTSPGSCFPTGPINLSQTGSQVSGSWTWGNSQPCQNAGIADKPFSGNLGVPSDNSIGVSFPTGLTSVDGTLTLSGNTIKLYCEDGDIISFARDSSDLSDENSNQQSGNWAGKWTQSSWETGSCLPGSEINISQSGTQLEASWTWSTSSQCENDGLSGQPCSINFNVPTANYVVLSSQVQGETIQGTFILNGNQASFVFGDGDSMTLTRAGFSENGSSNSSSTSGVETNPNEIQGSESGSADTQNSNQSRNGEVGKFAALLSASFVVSSMIFLA